MIPTDSSSCWRYLSNSTTMPAWIYSFWVGLWSHAGGGMPGALQHSCNLALPGMLWLSNVAWSSGALLSPAEKQSLSLATPAQFCNLKTKSWLASSQLQEQAQGRPQRHVLLYSLFWTPQQRHLWRGTKMNASQRKQWLEVWNLLFWICPSGSPCFCEVQKHSVKRSQVPLSKLKWAGKTQKQMICKQRLASCKYPGHKHMLPIWRLRN